MSVRWKPMILLSTLFVVLAGVGLLAITATMLPGGSRSILPQARAEAKAGKYDRAKIQYERALQQDPKNAEIHEELATMLADWLTREPRMAPKLRPLWEHALRNAANFGKTRPGPRRALLVDALDRGELSDALYWAKELQAIEPEDPDACYLLALEALDVRPARLDEARNLLKPLEAKQADRARTALVRARLAQASGDDAALGSILSNLKNGGQDGPGDSLARLQIRLLDLERTEGPQDLPERVEAFRREAQSLGIDDAAPGQVALLSQALHRAQTVVTTAAKRNPDAAEMLAGLGEGLEQQADSTYKKSIEVSGQVDLRPHLAYAEHLLLRGERQACLEAVEKALKLTLAAQPAWLDTSMELREVAVKAALSDTGETDRFARAAPYIKELLGSRNERYKALGHLFQGLVDLERSGLSDPSVLEAEGPAPKARDEQAAASANEHLAAAAAGLKDVAVAQALYGVALSLSGDRAVGRQYLQQAQKLGAGALDPRYQILAAWSVLQAGYPEDAEPIVDRLIAEVDRGDRPKTLAPSLHLLRGEIHQARRTPEALRLARESYRKAVAEGQPLTPSIKLRLAQIDAQLGEAGRALEQIEEVRGEAGAAADQLAILTLREQGQAEAANRRLVEARQKYPDSTELAGLDAAVRLEAGQARQAEAILTEFLSRHPDQMELTLLHARVLAGPLERPDDARKVLEGLAEHSDSTVPLVQIALLDLAGRDFDSVAKTIARIRARWKEAAAADLLDAQLAFARGDARTSAAFLDAALKKDPNNKVAMFWRAQLDELRGSTAEAQQIFESILRDRPVKQLDDGIPLTSAAQWALASMALDRQDFDGAITRFESLLRDQDASELQRPVRWKLAMARAARGEASQAKAEIDLLVADPKTSTDERVRAADFYRSQGLEADADRQLGLVLQANPGHSGALAYRGLMWASGGKEEQAIALLRKATESSPQPAGIYLLLAAIENRGKTDGSARALATIDAGLKVYPASPELVRARYEMMVAAKDPKALEFVEAAARSDATGSARRVLVDVYRQSSMFDKAEALVAEMLSGYPKESPQAAQLSSDLVGLVIAQATQAASLGDRAEEQANLSRASGFIKRFREIYPDKLDFPRYECELASSSGDLEKANRIAKEIAQLDKASPLGPLLLARLALSAERFDDAARSYEQAVERSPANKDLRLELGRVRLALGEHDDAVEQASAVLDVEKDSVEAGLLKAQALAGRVGTPSEVEAARTESARILADIIRKQPNLVEAYHLLSDLRVAQGHRDLAVQALQACLRAVPEDDAGLSLLVQRLVEGRAEKEAAALAATHGDRDERGVNSLAIAVGYHKAGRPELAVPWAERAAGKLDRPLVHLTLGDILLARAEGAGGSDRTGFEQAVAQYDLVLKQDPNSVEAVNNKAWILHRYLNRNAEAQALAESLTRKLDASRLPAEFYDTLGSIQEAAGSSESAESSYREGLRKAPDHPILNYHMGRLLASRPEDLDSSRSYLAKASEARASLPDSMATDLDQILARVGR